MMRFVIAPTRAREAGSPAPDRIDLVQRGVECGEGQCARVDVDSDDRLAVTRQQERLDATSRPQVERSPGRPAQGHPSVPVAGTIPSTRKLRDAMALPRCLVRPHDSLITASDLPTRQVLEPDAKQQTTNITQ
jgi:hypothetical protein